VLVKARLHNRSILIYAVNSELVSKVVCAIASLHLGGYSCFPDVPLQFPDTVNSKRNGYKLMGT
jgi:hypothetical protein